LQIATIHGFVLQYQKIQEIPIAKQ
jgi:hypothetical protein